VVSDERNKLNGKILWKNPSFLQPDDLEELKASNFGFYHAGGIFPACFVCSEVFTRAMKRNPQNLGRQVKILCVAEVILFSAAFYKLFKYD